MTHSLFCCCEKDFSQADLVQHLKAAHGIDSPTTIRHIVGYVDREGVYRDMSDMSGITVFYAHAIGSLVFHQTEWN